MHEETQHDPDAERAAREQEREQREREQQDDDEQKQGQDEQGDADSAVDEPDEERDPNLEPGT
jgi:hypothetical protein